jgi:hypothetical protein
MFPTFLPRNGTNNIHGCGIKAADPGLHNEKVRFRCHAGGDTKI